LKEGQKMFIVVGLGNPGRKYAKTRHNMGFIAADELAQKLDIKINKIKHKSLVGEGYLAGQKVLLVKPQTYMNLSGEAVREIMHYYRVESEKILLIYDDVDIETGRIRIRKKGGAGTHNGMKSVVAAMGTEEFPRIRIGIGGDIKMHLMDFVTGGMNKKEKETLKEAVITAAEAAECIIEKGIDAAMNRYNSRVSEKEEWE